MYLTMYNEIISNYYNKIYKVIHNYKTNDQYNFMRIRKNYKFLIKIIHFEAKFTIINTMTLSKKNKQILLNICDNIFIDIDKEFNLNLKN
jgi:hypothetical protein